MLSSVNTVECQHQLDSDGAAAWVEVGERERSYMFVLKRRALCVSDLTNDHALVSYDTHGDCT